MQTDSQLKELVKQKYGEIALQDAATNASSCCGSGCCSLETSNIMTDDYSTVAGYEAAADLGLGCGLPTQFAKIKAGDVVIDLGSGAGNDCFVARHEAGESGRIIGIDFTPAMIAKARENVAKLGYTNVEFREGDIENMPVASDTADVIVSNCVLNLVPNKKAVIREIFRVLKAGGHFSISDIVLEGELPSEIQQAAEMYVGCVAGAIQKEVYLELIRKNGFENIVVQKEKKIDLPADIGYNAGDAGIYSITVYAEKPSATKACCGPTCCS